MWRLKEKKWWEWSKEYRRWSLHPNYCWSEMKGEGCRHAEQSIHPVTQDSSHPLSISKCSQKKSSSTLILKYDYSHTVRHWRWRAHHSFFLQYIYRLSERTAVKWICTQILTIKGIITQNLTKLYNIMNKYAELYRAPQRHACHFPRLSTWEQAQEQSTWLMRCRRSQVDQDCTKPGSERAARASTRKRSQSMDQKEEPEHGEPEHGSGRAARAWIRKSSRSMESQSMDQEGQPEHGSERAARAWIRKSSQSMDQEGQPEHGSERAAGAWRAKAWIRKGSQSMDHLDQEGQPEHASEMQQTFIHELQWAQLSSMSYCGSNCHPWAIVGQTDIHELLWVKLTSMSSHTLWWVTFHPNCHPWAATLCGGSCFIQTVIHELSWVQLFFLLFQHIPKCEFDISNLILISNF